MDKETPFEMMMKMERLHKAVKDDILSTCTASTNNKSELTIEKLEEVAELVENLCPNPIHYKFYTRLSEPEEYQIKRSWKERLFKTKPWQPLKKTKTYIDKGAIERNRQVIEFNGNIYCTNEMRKDIMEKIK